MDGPAVCSIEAPGVSGRRGGELAEWETAIVKLKVEDVEFEEDRMEVVWLVVNHRQLSSNGVDSYQVQGSCRY